ncbi:MAG: fibronectin type III domain-containing protein [Phycisphaerales bacterium JB063]
MNMSSHANVTARRSARTLLTVAAFFFALALAATPAAAETARFRLSWRADPATTVVIGWDQVSGNSPVVYWGDQDHGYDHEAYPHQSTPDTIQHYRGMNNHFVRLTGLRPDTAYYFVIKDSESTSRRFWFRTAPDQPQPFAFVAGGDSRSNGDPRREGNRLVAKLRPLFVCHGGDYMGVGSAEEWVQWFDDWQLTISEDGRIYPLVPAHGNHENRDMEMVYRLFDMPRPEMYHAVSVGGSLMRLYTLNTEISNDRTAWAAQHAWIQQDLALHRESTWKFVQHHRPMRPHTSAKAEGLIQIATWAQLFYDEGVDVVIECDTHMVKRTYPLRPSEESGSYESFIRDDERGTVYIGEGSWGAPIRPADDDKPWTMASDSFYQFKWIHVTPEHMDIRSVRFENVDAVASVRDDAPFAVPDGLVLWQPPTGEVLRLPFSVDDATYTDGGQWSEVFNPRSLWRYSDAAQAPAEDWFAADYDDSQWKTGHARLGYGDDGEATTLSYGDNADEKHAIAYFRTTFAIENTDDIQRVIVGVLADDGFVAYLNGQEIGRRRVADGDLTEAPYATQVVGDQESYDGLDIDPTLLVEGENVLCVQVHQANARSSDLSLDARVRVLRQPEGAE